MEFISAFIIGGFLCLIFQLFMMVTKLSVPKILIIGLFAGGILTWLGVCDFLSSTGGAGFQIMVIGAAQGVYNGCLALFAGSPIAILTILGIFAVLIVLGLVAGAVRVSVEARKSDRHLETSID